jgi:hypothetical protein
MLFHLYHWWVSLSVEVRAGVVAAIVSPVIAVLIGVPEKMFRLFHIRLLRRLEKAEKELRERLVQELHPIIPINDAWPFDLEQKAKQAKMWLWLAKKAESYKADKEMEKKLNTL